MVTTTSMDTKLQEFETLQETNEETSFTVNSRAARKLGTWAARSMRMSEEQAENFVSSELFEYLSRLGMTHVMQFVSVKLKENGVHLSDYVIQRQKERFVKEACVEAMQMRFHPSTTSH